MHQEMLPKVWVCTSFVQQTVITQHSQIKIRKEKKLTRKRDYYCHSFLLNPSPHFSATWHWVIKPQWLPLIWKLITRHHVFIIVKMTSWSLYNLFCLIQFAQELWRNGWNPHIYTHWQYIAGDEWGRCRRGIHSFWGQNPL